MQHQICSISPESSTSKTKIQLPKCNGDSVDCVGGSSMVERCIGKRAVRTTLSKRIPTSTNPHRQVARPDPVRHRGGAARDGHGDAKHVDGVGFCGRCVGRGHLHLDDVAAHAEVDLEVGGHGVGVRQCGVRVVEILDRRRRLACRLGDRDLGHRIRDRRLVARRGRAERRAERRAAHRQGAQRRVGGVGDRVRIATDDDAERLVGPGLKHPGTAALPVELVFDAPVREAERRIFSAGSGGVELHAPGADLLDHHHVVGVRREGEAGVREVQVPGREARRGRQGRAVAGGGGGKLVCGAILLADLDVEVVALVVLGVDDHLGERVAGRVGTRLEQLRMVVATGVGAVIGRLPGVAHEDAHRLRLRRGRPEEQQAQDEDGGGGAAWTGVPQGPGSIPRPGGRGGETQSERWSLGKSRRSARLGSARLGSARLGSARLGSARLGSALMMRAKGPGRYCQVFFRVIHNFFPSAPFRLDNRAPPHTSRKSGLSEPTATPPEDVLWAPWARSIRRAQAPRFPLSMPCRLGLSRRWRRCFPALY